MPTLDLDPWLKGEEIRPEAKLVFINQGEVKKIPQGEGKEQKEVFEIKVQLPNTQIRLWTMNRTAQRAVAQSYGMNTDTWVGKSVRAFVQDENVMGTMRAVIYARIPEVPDPLPPKVEAVK